MSITRALGNAYSGLAAAQARASVTSNNIANASTPGYVRRDVVLTERTIAGQGFGVQVQGISRSQDLALTADRRDAQASAARADIISRSYTELNTALGEPGDGFGLFAAYQDFEDSLRELALTPESSPLQNRLASDAARLTSEFNDLSAIGRRQRSDADGAIAQAVSIINDNLYTLKSLNGDIARVNEEGGEAAGFEDERQRVLDEISQYLPITTIDRGNGRIDVMTKEGVFLLANNVHELSFTQTAVITEGMTYANGALSGLFVGNQDISPAGSSLGISSGLLAGAFAVRDETAPEFLNQIDALAADLIGRFSDDALDPTKTPGAPGLFTNNGLPLDPLNTGGIASRISLNAAVDPAQGGEVWRLRDGLGAVAQGDSGDATFLNNLIDAYSTVDVAPAGTGLNGQYSALEAAAGVISSVGEARVRYDSILTSANARTQVLVDAELSKTGVDTDQELQSLLLIEQAYAANARVIQTIGTMIDRLLEL